MKCSTGKVLAHHFAIAQPPHLQSFTPLSNPLKLLFDFQQGASMHRLWVGVALAAVQALAAPFHASMAPQTPNHDGPPSPHASSNYPRESFIIEKHYTTARFENN